MLRACWILYALPLVLLAACRPDPMAKGSHDPAGEVGAISVEAVEPDPAAELLPNGAFEEWYGGLPAPTGFEAPKNTAITSIHRDVKSAHLNTPGYTTRQTWQQADLGGAPEAGFHTAVTLAPDTGYTLDVVASATPGMAAGIGVYEVDATLGVRVLARDVVMVSGSEPARYRGAFQTVAGGTILLASHAQIASAFPGTVTWSAWSLRPETAVADPPVTLADQPARRMLVNNALDQVRSQIAMYGGQAAWAESLYPVEKNITRILRESESQPGESLLGYDGYVFRKQELAYYADAHDLSRRPDGGDTAAWRAILKAERSLAWRGIDFVALPVPDRIHLYVDRIYQAAAEGALPILPHTRLMERFLQQDVLAPDAAPLLWRYRNEGRAVYWRGDSAIPSFTLQALAEVASPAVRALLDDTVPLDKKVYTVVVDTIPLEQPLVDELMPSLRGHVAPESCAIHSVREEAGALFTSPAQSSVLAVGSVAVAHHIRGASFAAHLSRSLGLAVAVPSKNLADPAAPAYLVEGAPELEGVKVVVFCFPEAALIEAGWE